jgi:hypothetical protein
MKYVEEVLNRKTGELETVSMGDWLPLTELGQVYRQGPKQIRTILRKMGVLVVEGADRHQRHRLAPWVMQRGWGKRIEARRGRRFPFDVVGPDLQQWIADRWEATVSELEQEATAPSLAARAALHQFTTSRSEALSVQQSVCWLADYFPQLTQNEVAMVLDVTQQLVAKYQNIRSAHRRRAWELRTMDLDVRQALGRSCGDGEEDDQLGR